MNNTLDRSVSTASSIFEISIEAPAQGLSTPAIQAGIDACAKNGGGRLILKAGRYLIATIVLRSGVTLHLERGAELVATHDMSLFVRRDGVATAMIFAEGQQQIAITGHGTINGNAMRGVAERREWVEAKKPMGTWIPAADASIIGERPLAMIVLADCRHVLMEDVYVTNSPRWTIQLVACTHLTLRRLTVRSPDNACNGDGIDLDGCSHALVEDCDIETGDDAVCLKCTGAFGYQRPTRHIIIRRCRLRSTCHGFCIGHETQDDFEDVTFTDCTIERFGPHRVLTGIALGMIDGAAIRRIHISNIEMSDVVAPFHIRLSNEGRVFRGVRTSSQQYGSIYIDLNKNGPRGIGSISDIVIERVNVRRAWGNSFISGLPGNPLKNLAFRDVAIDFAGPTEPAMLMPTVPELESEYPKDAMWRFLPAFCLFCRHIEGLEFTNVTIQKTIADTRPAIVMDDVSGYTPTNVRV